jgi:hypothetical protein
MPRRHRLLRTNYPPMFVRQCCSVPVWARCGVGCWVLTALVSCRVAPAATSTSAAPTKVSEVVDAGHVTAAADAATCACRVGAVLPAVPPPSSPGDALAREAQACGHDLLCTRPLSSPLDACLRTQTARFYQERYPDTPRERQPPEIYPCELLQPPIGNGGPGVTEAALLTVEDFEEDVPVVLAFGENGFAHVLSLLSIDASPGMSGELKVNRFELTDVNGDGNIEVLLFVTQTAHAESADDGDGTNMSRELMTICKISGGAACRTLMLADTAGWVQYDEEKRFKVDAQWKDGQLTLKRISGRVPENTRRWLGTHKMDELFQAPP